MVWTIGASKASNSRATVSPDRAPDPTFLAWGQNVYQRINASLAVPGSNLYAETANVNGTTSGGDGGFAYVWPEATLFRVLDDLVGADRSYAPAVRAFADELYTRYWTTTAPGGKQQALPGEGLGGDAGLASGRSKVPTVLWGLLTALIGFGWWWTVRQRRHWVSYVGPAVPFLIALFFFYAHLELLLPANF